jgi:AsmA protein
MKLPGSRRHWIIGACSLVALLLLAAVVTPFLIDIDKFRPMLEEKASADLGRRVTLGHLSLSILAGKVRADDIQIDDNPAFSQSPFLSARSVEIGIQVMPLLLSQRVNVTRITIDRPAISVLRAADGTYNFSNLGAAASSVSQNLNSANAALAAVSVRKLVFSHGKLMLGQANSSGTHVFDDLNIEVSNFSSTSEFPFKVTATLPGGGNAVMTGKAGPLQAQNIAGTPFKAAVKTTDTNIATYEFIDPRSGIAGTGASDVTIESDGNTQILSGTLTATGLRLSASGTPLPGSVTIAHRVQANLQQESLKIMQADVAVGKAVFHVTGEIGKFFNEKTLNCQFKASNAPMDDVQNLLRALNVKMPLGSHLQGGSMTANLAITGTGNAPVAAGPVHVVNSALVGFNLGAQLGSAGEWAGKAASAPDTAFSSLSVDLKATPAGFQLNNIDLQIPQVAEARGTGTITPERVVAMKLIAYPSSGMAGTLTRMAAAGGSHDGVPVAVSGTVEKPVIDADVSTGAHSMAGAAAKGAASSAAHSIGKFFGKK